MRMIMVVLHGIEEKGKSISDEEITLETAR